MSGREGTLGAGEHELKYDLGVLTATEIGESCSEQLRDGMMIWRNVTSRSEDDPNLIARMIEMCAVSSAGSFPQTAPFLGASGRVFDGQQQKTEEFCMVGMLSVAV